MVLRTHIREQLWQAISSNYEAEHYSNAIVDAMHCLSEVLREKSGLDGDGQSLVGRALGGRSPLLQVNKLQTETERNVQDGLVKILLGLYAAVRNPRHHSQTEDDKATADAIIYFIDYILQILDDSKEPFTIPALIERVFDPYFVKEKRYADLLANEIPSGKLLDTLIVLFRQRNECEQSNVLTLMSTAMINRMTKEQVAEYFEVVSSELTSASELMSIRTALEMLPTETWSYQSEMARLRVEEMVVRSIEEGEADDEGDLIYSNGWFATWARRFIPSFTSKGKVTNAFIKKLSGEASDRKYILLLFSKQIPEVLSLEWHGSHVVRAILELDDEDEAGVMLSRIRGEFAWLPMDWQQALNQALEEREAGNEISILEEGSDIPF